jgi:hypothetical protein
VIPLFLGITAVNLLSLIAAITIGYLTRSHPSLKSVHLLTGVLATFVCVAMHCVVFTYFIATAKWVQHAVSVKKLDESLASPTRSFRAQAFPAALIAMFIVFVTAILGAAHDNYGTPRDWHLWLALSTLLINALVACVEFRAITRNGQLIDTILTRINTV